MYPIYGTLISAASYGSFSATGTLGFGALFIFVRKLGLYGRYLITSLDSYISLPSAVVQLVVLFTLAFAYVMSPPVFQGMASVFHTVLLNQCYKGLYYIYVGTSF